MDDDPVGAGRADLERWMGLALEEAALAVGTGDVPVGAVLVDREGTVTGRGRNEREAAQDPTAHAELLALREAARAAGSWRLDGATLVVTLEPCAMCAGAIVLARVARVVLGAWDPKAGATGSSRDIVRDARLNHRVEVVGGVLEAQAAGLLTDFFAERR
ncbi:tRNA adenosine(34) deaminase TadA [Kineosporia succinea]|uniref:tRNA-specific adenosine deaminase n=1 Tax=Kineosporia succinea TaxID=84632 RepID=A0ABT9P0A1_9ACTN|nr:tRNA adenosine(34) deaminase TadA [Kineosporia succinea]MDP9826103.1 tRNA(adenine34) deaminase [Kineosporia succinea]